MDTVKILGQEYKPRLIDQALVHALDAAGAVVIEGARATGKTMTALQAAKSYVFLDDVAAQRALEIAPDSLLEGESPRLLDEWQIAPELWNIVRRAVDASTEPGKFILTGSAVPADDVTRHTGAGRFIRLRQQTMTTWEKSSNAAQPVSISKLFDGEHPKSDLSSAPTIDEVIGEILRPGFPAMRHLEPEKSAARLRAYIDDVARADVQRIADLRHGPAVIEQLITALARSVASDVTYRTLASDVRAVAPSINEETVRNYVDVLKRLYVVEEQMPWTPKLRSRARMRTGSKLHLVDPALAAAALGAGHKRLREDLLTLGLLFESAVIHDLTAFAAALGGEVRHYRDSYDKEIDAILTLPDGRWAAVEVKLGGGQAAVGIESLNAVIDQIDTDAVGLPAFRLVVTGTGSTFTAKDGTVTAPLHALAP